MAICRFFQEGNCRFGNRCWNEHVRDSRYSNQYNSENQSNQFSTRQENRTQPNTSSGFSFKAALQRVGHSQPQFEPQPQPPPQPVASGAFSFTKTFNAIQNAPRFENQLPHTQPFGSSVIHPSGFGFQSSNTSFRQSVPTFGQNAPQMSFFGNRSSFGVPQPEPVNRTSHADIDMNISEQTSLVSGEASKPQIPQMSQPIVQSPGGDNSVYSTLDSLTEEELNSFKANEFTFMKIPLKPPPVELCF